ncbi:eukaryotic translation initiation factor 2D isoform X2 [Zootermopsis nevadensis]|nr:eukaryotic translation initiation factor 2D isoform X2 [Zootermopsis nevadensis]
MKQFPQISENDLQALFPPKEVMSAVKIITHGGDLSVVYCVQKLPLIFELEQKMYPTVCMLWSFPSILPSFTTWPQVFNRLAGGADLMLPGIVLKRQLHVKAYGNLQKGEAVAINMTTNKAPVAVGVTALSSFDMYMAAQRGKAVKILHFVGDELWSYGTKLTIPELGPPPGYEVEVDISSLSVEDSNPANTEHTIKAESELVNKSDAQTASLPGDLEKNAVENLRENATDLILDVVSADNSEDLDMGKVFDSNGILQEHTGIEVVPELGVNPQEVMDKLLEYCFLKAWKTSAKKIGFPLLTSNFYKLHMLPACPSGKQLDLKRSSHKKLSKFLSAMENLDLIKVTELTKGVESIMMVNRNHPMYKEFVDIEESFDDAGKMTEASAKTVKPAIVELYTVTAAVLPLFSKFGLRKGGSLPVADVRKHVTDYVKKEKLQDPMNRNLVRVDAVLQAAVQNPNTVAVSWEDLMGLIIGRMSHSYQMTFSDHKTVAQKGKLDPIDIQVGRRTGNKKVTLINNLELYGINIQEFARECQHGVAASTSISTVQGKKSQQLLVQGNQVLFVGNLLMGKYQIPKHYIRGLDSAPRQKK